MDQINTRKDQISQSQQKSWTFFNATFLKVTSFQHAFSYINDTEKSSSFRDFSRLRNISQSTRTGTKNYSSEQTAQYQKPI